MNKKTIALTLLGLASAFALTTTSVKAVETTNTTGSNITIQGSDLSVSNVTDKLEFRNLTIDGEGSARTSSATGDLQLIIADLRGTRGGWHVTAEHTGLSTSDEGDRLDGTTISLTGASLTNNVDSSTNAPTLDLTSPLSIGTESVLISNAAEGNGMGSWVHSWTAGNINLTIPAKEARDMYADQYTTTINWNLVAGPQVTESIPAG